MILGPLAHTNLPLLSTPTGTIDRVTSFKLLGLHIDSSLSWANHISIITQKASSRLYFLKQLKRAGLASNHLLHFYIAVIRPVLEYCAPVWHYAFTQAHPRAWSHTEMSHQSCILSPPFPPLLRSNSVTGTSRSRLTSYE